MGRLVAPFTWRLTEKCSQSIRDSRARSTVCRSYCNAIEHVDQSGRRPATRPASPPKDPRATFLPVPQLRATEQVDCQCYRTLGDMSMSFPFETTCVVRGGFRTRSNHCMRILGRGSEERHSDLYKCARIGVGQPQFPAKFFRPLAHSSDADANAARPPLRDWVFDPFAIVPYHDHCMTFSLGQRNPRFLCTRMPVNIRQSLLNDTEDCGL